MSYSSSHLTCFSHVVIWVNSSYHHQSLSFFHNVIYILDFIPFIFTFLTPICLLILSLMFHSTSLSFYLSNSLLHSLRHIIITGSSIGCPCVHGSLGFLCIWNSTHEGARLIIGYLSLVFIHLFYLITLSLHYGLCRKTTLRP